MHNPIWYLCGEAYWHSFLKNSSKTKIFEFQPYMGVPRELNAAGLAIIMKDLTLKKKKDLALNEWFFSYALDVGQRNNRS